MPARTWRNMPSFYNLTGSRCNGCSHLEFPKAAACRKCGSQDLSEHSFSGTGKIETYTIIRQPFNEEGMAEQLVCSSPYAIAIVRLDEGPMITAQLADCEAGEIAIGKPVKAVLRKISEGGDDGLIRYGYKFVLA
ncbi:Zn-ribbon domain-containing OB-fold protein [Candidatus Woesearchaeota archaeon]|nr:Zn-ribbon domain-containing OB-fold protein [Candidatus Woesearchaeota archaeon]